MRHVRLRLKELLHGNKASLPGEVSSNDVLDRVPGSSSSTGTFDTSPTAALAGLTSPPALSSTGGDAIDDAETKELLRRISANSEELAQSLTVFTSPDSWTAMRQQMIHDQLRGDSPKDSPKLSSDESALEPDQHPDIHRRGPYSHRERRASPSPEKTSSPVALTRLRNMSEPELIDAIERADSEARFRKWARKSGGSLADAGPQKIIELEVKAHRLSQKASKHRALAADETLPAYARALSLEKLKDYEMKHEKALRVKALLEQSMRASSHTPPKQRSRGGSKIARSCSTRDNWSARGDPGAASKACSPSPPSASRFSGGLSEQTSGR